MKKILLLSLFAIIFSGCVGKMKHDYSAFLQSNPKSILVLMPTNDTTEPEASAAVLANSLLPLSEAGYYVFPMALVNETFKQNGLTEPSDIVNISLEKLRQYFNPDSVLYLNVSRYGTSFQLFNSNTSVSVEAKLVDAKNENIIWERAVMVQENSNNVGNGLLGMLISAVVSQIINTASDASFKLSVRAGHLLYIPDCYDCLLRGYRSSKFRQDLQLK